MYVAAQHSSHLQPKQQQQQRQVQNCSNETGTTTTGDKLVWQKVQQQHHQKVCLHRSAMALNNAAVSLFARGCLSQGKSLLRQAIDIMRACSSSAAFSSTAPESNGDAANDADIGQMDRHLAQLSSWSQAFPLLPHVEVLDGLSSHDPVILSQIFSCSSSFAATSSTTTMYVVRMDEALLTSCCGCNDDSDGHSQDKETDNHNKLHLEVISAICFYNFGVAKILSLRGGRTSTSSGCSFSQQQQQHQSVAAAALQLLQAAHVLLVRSGVLMMLHGLPDTTACVNILALELMVQILSQSKGRGEAAAAAVAASQALQETREHFGFVLGRVLQGSGMVHISAAAA